MGILVYDKTLKAYTLKASKNQQDVRAYMAIDPHTDTNQSPEEKILLVGTERLESPTGEVTYKDIIHYPKSGELEDPNDPNSVDVAMYSGLWSGTCGTTNPSPNPELASGRIVGGIETEAHQFCSLMLPI